MQFPRAENKVNWTTVVSLFMAAFTVSGSIGAWLYSQGQFQAQFQTMQNTQDVSQTRTDTRLETLERTLGGVENLAYRVTLIEQANLSTTSALAEITRAQSEQSADIRVIREILSRLENSQNNGP